MNALAIPLRCTATAADNPDLFYIIGRLTGSGIPAVTRNRFDELRWTGYGEIALGLLLEVIPEGIIFQNRLNCYVTNRGKLIPFDITRGDWTSERQARAMPEPTVQEIHEDILEAGKELTWVVAHDRGRA